MPRLIALLALTAACGPAAAPPPDAEAPPPAASDAPIAGLSPAELAAFEAGDALFELPFRPADGLGPLYIRSACAACHAHGARGPGLVQKMVVVEADGATPAADQSALAFGPTLRDGLTAGATTPIGPPPGVRVKRSIRVGPPVLGRGYLEAVDPAELARLEAEQAARPDAIHGRRNRVPFASIPNPDPTYARYQTGEIVTGVLGLKARIATLDDFTADAFAGDMGLTTPMRPREPVNPDRLADDLRAGVDLDQAHIDQIAFYLRRVAIPPRSGLTDDGARLFHATACDACHVPTLRTRPDYPIAQLAGIAAPIYSDLLVHDLGPALADGVTDGEADGRAWRTAPLIGLRFLSSFLHDGRAADVAAAIAAHDGEARASADAFAALSAAERDRLLTFVQAL